MVAAGTARARGLRGWLRLSLDGYCLDGAMSQIAKIVAGLSWAPSSGEGAKKKPWGCHGFSRPDIRLSRTDLVSNLSRAYQLFQDKSRGFLSTCRFFCPAGTVGNQPRRWAQEPSRRHGRFPRWGEMRWRSRVSCLGKTPDRQEEGAVIAPVKVKLDLTSPRSGPSAALLNSLDSDWPPVDPEGCVQYALTPHLFASTDCNTGPARTLPGVSRLGS
jgi:hypothetical protein